MAFKNYLITIAAAVFIVGGTVFAISWAQGYRPSVKDGTLKATGLLVANSFPTGAQVYVDGKLVTATDNTINFDPGEYMVKISKDGYLSWEKKLKLQKELVTQTNALLFPAAPDLKALTFTGAINPTPSPDGEKIAFAVASASAATKNGLYILDMSRGTLSFRAETSQIAISTPTFNFTDAKLIWSPDSTQILAYRQNQNAAISSSVLLDAGRNNEANLVDQTARLQLTLSDWNEQLAIKTQEKFSKLPTKLQEILSSSATHLYWSPDEEKILYTATASANIPDGLAIQLPASNTQPQHRSLEKGNIYVYDIKEDRNFLVGETIGKSEKTNAPSPTSTPTAQKNSTLLSPTQPNIATPSLTVSQLIVYIAEQYSPIYSQEIQWFPNSRHLIAIGTGKIIALEYDGTNKVTLYGGPFQVDGERPFVYPGPDASKLVLLTTLNKDNPPNLYGLNLK